MVHVYLISCDMLFDNKVLFLESAMLMGDLFIVLFLCFIPYVWWIDRGIKQYAYVLAVNYCKQHDLLLLDDTVQQTKFEIKRDEQGSLKIHRYFSFEFTSTGERRYTGTFEYCNKRIRNMQLDAYQI